MSGRPISLRYEYALDDSLVTPVVHVLSLPDISKESDNPYAAVLCNFAKIPWTTEIKTYASRKHILKESIHPQKDIHYKFNRFSVV